MVTGIKINTKKIATKKCSKDNLRRWVTRWTCVGCFSSTVHRRSALLGIWRRIEKTHWRSRPMHVSHRCLGRGAAGSGRTDDNEESLRKRFVTYEEATMPIIRLNSTYMLIMTEDWRVFSENTVHFRHSGRHVSDVWSIDHWCNKLLTVHFTIFQALWKVEPGSPTGCNQVSGWSFCGGGKDHLRLQVRGSCWNSQPWLVNHSTSNQLTPKISCISVLIWKLSFLQITWSYPIVYNTTSLEVGVLVVQC